MPHTTLSPRTRSLALAMLFCLIAARAAAMLAIDFEQPYLVHPGLQVWDHCIVEHDGLYHIFYHGMPESSPDPSNSDHIWRATSPDLIHWTEPEIVLSVSEAPYEARALWAPDVVFDPDTDLWWMAYTGVDELRNQRICMAVSPDLGDWTKLGLNPVLEPDPAIFLWEPSWGWGECRDPHLFQQDGVWKMAVSAKALAEPEAVGAVGISTSTDLVNWSPLEILLLNDDDWPPNALESPQYIERGEFHHIFFHQYATSGITHIVSLAPEGWHLFNGNQIDLGIAPEVETFDGGQNFIFTRIAPYQEPDRPNLSFVARMDTLAFQDGVAAPQVLRPHPLSVIFQSYGGNACLGNPCFGDNPARRGEDPVNLEGNWYFGSREYYQGPLSGRGDPGRLIGDAAQGYVQTAPFVVQGSTISLLCGGTYDPDHCFVALQDAATDSLLRHATGYDIETMSRRWWDVSDLQGVEVYLRIQDSSSTGHINVDDIRESDEVITEVASEQAPGAGLLVDRGPRPNPFNPATEIRFELTAPADCRVRIHDLRGCLVWDSGSFRGLVGSNAVAWRGIDRVGERAAAGVYVYGIEARGRMAASGKLTLIP